MEFARNRANEVSEPEPYRDPSGRTLADYPRPSVAVDTAVLTVADQAGLSVVLVRPSPADDPSAHGCHRLPGTFLHEGERLAEAVVRSLRDKAGVTGLDPRQLHVFDEPDRDDRGRVLSVAHLVTVPAGQLTMDEEKAVLVAVERLPAVAYQHDAIVDLAVAALRADYASAPDPRQLLEAPFTLRDLQALHETIAGTAIPRDAFRRAMEGRLAETGRTRQGVVGKPARLFELARAS